jgi:hypothetical protein
LSQCEISSAKGLGEPTRRCQHTTLAMLYDNL